MGFLRMENYDFEKEKIYPTKKGRLVAALF